MNKNVKRVLGVSSILVGVLGASVFAASSNEELKAKYSFQTGRENGVKYANVEHLDENPLSEEKMNTLKEKYTFQTGKVRGASYKTDSGDEVDKTEYSFRTGRENGQKYADVEGTPLTDEEMAERKAEYGFQKGRIHTSDETEDADKTNYSFQTGRKNGVSHKPVEE